MSDRYIPSPAHPGIVGCTGLERALTSFFFLFFAFFLSRMDCFLWS